jgi:hypothetical protein
MNKTCNFLGTILVIFVLSSCAILDVKAEKSEVLFRRTDTSTRVKVNIILDERDVGSIRPGQTRTFKVSNGKHIVSVNSALSPSDQPQSSKIEFDLNFKYKYEVRINAASNRAPFLIDEESVQGVQNQ